jgi:hypothetical protein
VERVSLREALADWTDWDGAGHALGVCLGLMPAEPGWGRTKHVFWARHPVGDRLYRMLEDMVAVGILERREEPDFQFRWNPGFKGSWEEPPNQSLQQTAGA